MRLSKFTHNFVELFPALAAFGSICGTGARCRRTQVLDPWPSLVTLPGMWLETELTWTGTRMQDFLSCVPVKRGTSQHERATYPSFLAPL